VRVPSGAMRGGEEKRCSPDVTTENDTVNAWLGA